MASLLRRGCRRLIPLWPISAATQLVESVRQQSTSVVQEDGDPQSRRPQGVDIVNRFQELSWSRSGSAQAWKSAVTELESSVNQLSPSAVARLLHLCKVSREPQPRAVTLLMSTARTHLEAATFSNVDAATVIHSLAVLVRSAKGRQLEAIHSQIQELALDLSEFLVQPHRVHSLSDRILANVLYGLGVLYKSDGAELHHPRLEGVIQALSQQICLERHLLAFAQQGLANILYAYGSLKWRSDAVLWRLSREIINRIGGFVAREIAYMIFALSRLNYCHEALVVTLGLEAVSGQHLTQFTEQELCNLLYGLSSLMEGLSSNAKLQPVMQRLLKEAGSTPRMHRFNGQDISTLLQSIAALKTHMELTPQQRELSHRLLAQFDALMGRSPKLDRHLNAVLSACAKLELRDERFLQRANALILHHSQELQSLWTVSLLLWSLASLRALSADAFVALGHQICTLRERGAEMTDRNWVQLTQATQYMKQSRELVQLDPNLKDLLEEALNISKATHEPFTLPSNPMDAPR